MVGTIDVLLVALGGAIGGSARYGVSGLVARRAGETFPWGTMAVNVSGALTIGLLAAAIPPSAGAASTSPAWGLLAIGVLGSYTTVSSFSLQTLELARRGEIARAGLHIGLSFLLCPPAAALGFFVGRGLVGG